MTTSNENIKEEYGGELYNLVKKHSPFFINKNYTDQKQFQITNYKLVSKEYDNNLDQDFINKIEILRDDPDMCKTGEWTDEELIVMISLLYVNDIHDYCLMKNLLLIDYNHDNEIKNHLYEYEYVCKPILERLAKIKYNSNYHYFFLMLNKAIPSLEFKNDEYKILYI